jgi:hypothetical protein
MNQQVNHQKDLTNVIGKNPNITSFPKGNISVNRNSNTSIKALETKFAEYNTLYFNLQKTITELIRSENNGLNKKSTPENIMKVLNISENKKNNASIYQEAILKKYDELKTIRKLINDNYIIPINQLKEQIKIQLSIIQKILPDIFSKITELKQVPNRNNSQNEQLTTYRTDFIPRLNSLEDKFEKLLKTITRDSNIFILQANNIITLFKFQIKDYVITHFMNIIKNKVNEIQQKLVGITNQSNLKTSIIDLIKYKKQILEFTATIQYINNIVAPQFLQNEYSITTEQQQTLNSKKNNLTRSVFNIKLVLNDKINPIKIKVDEYFAKSSQILEANTTSLIDSITLCMTQINQKIEDLLRNIKRNKNLENILNKLTLENKNTFKNYSANIKKTNNLLTTSKNKLITQLNTMIKNLISKLGPLKPANNAAGPRNIGQNFGVPKNDSQAKSVANELEWKTYVKKCGLNTILLTGKAGTSGKKEILQETKKYLNSHPNISQNLKNKITKYRQTERNKVY